MKKHYLLPFLLLMGYGISAQVGINTTDPKATLDVVKSSDATKPQGIIPPRVTGDELRTNSALYGAAQNGAIVYVTAPVTVTTEPKTTGVTTRGLFIYDAVEPNGTGTGLWQVLPDGPATPSSSVGDGAYAAKFKGNLSLVSVNLSTLFSSNFYYLPLSASSTTVTTEISSQQVTNNEYTIPSNGIYQVNFSFRTGQGLTAQLLSNNPPSIAIVKQVGTTYSLLDSRTFGGLNLLDLSGLLSILNVVVVNITLTQGQISHIYNLNAGDKLRFGVVKGGLDVDAISDKSAEISIYKIK